jgi:hypothetical protein
MHGCRWPAHQHAVRMELLTRIEKRELYLL